MPLCQVSKPLCIESYRNPGGLKRNKVGQHCSNLLRENGSNYPLLPTPTPKDQGTHDCERRKCDGNGEKYTSGTHPQPDAKHVSKRNLPKPEYEEVDYGWRPRIAGPIERLAKHHAVSVKEKSVSDYAQTIDSIMSDLGLGIVERNDLRRENDEHQPHQPEKDHVVKPSLPDCAFGAFRITSAERLADHSRGCVRHSPRRQQSEKDHANPDRVPGHRVAAETGDDAYQSNPARHADEHLKRSGG